MLDVASQGGSVERFGRGFPIHSILKRVVLGCGLLSGLCWLPGARASVLYHCTGIHGETVYSSSTVGYRGCRKISAFGNPAPRRRVAPLPTSLTAVADSVTTTAHVLVAQEGVQASLAGVQAGVETSARALGDPQLQRPSFAAVHGSVETSAKLSLATSTAGTPGQWSYHESREGIVAPASIPDDSASRVLRGAVYRVVRADGSVEYTNLPQTSQKGHTVTMLFSYIATCFACNLHSPIRWGSVSLNLTAYADVIRAASIEYGVDEAFLRAIIHAESAFNPRAMSVKGAQGLMQLMPSTASDMGVLDAFDTDQNIRGGARYLSLLLHDFNGSEQLAAAAYNAGPGAVQRYSGVPPYAETQVYVVRVGTLRKRYGAALHPPLASSGSN
ncbi:MAG TPA: lytic transglycosylase domain-containing protein [Rhodanobacter sp.]